MISIPPLSGLVLRQGGIAHESLPSRSGLCPRSISITVISMFHSGLVNGRVTGRSTEERGNVENVPCMQGGTQDYLGGTGITLRNGI